MIIVYAVTKVRVRMTQGALIRNRVLCVPVGRCVDMVLVFFFFGHERETEAQRERQRAREMCWMYSMCV